MILNDVSDKIQILLLKMSPVGCWHRQTPARFVSYVEISYTLCFGGMFLTFGCHVYFQPWQNSVLLHLDSKAGDISTATAPDLLQPCRSIQPLRVFIGIYNFSTAERSERHQGSALTKDTKRITICRRYIRFFLTWCVCGFK